MFHTCNKYSYMYLNIRLSCLCSVVDSCLFLFQFFSTIMAGLPYFSPDGIFWLALHVVIRIKMRSGSIFTFSKESQVGDRLMVEMRNAWNDRQTDIQPFKYYMPRIIGYFLNSLIADKKKKHVRNAFQTFSSGFPRTLEDHVYISCAVHCRSFTNAWQIRSNYSHVWRIRLCEI